MYTVTVDGSFCSQIQNGGIGGYLLDENLSYKDHFHYTLNNKVSEKYFELLAIIAGMNLCLSYDKKELHIQSDELDSITIINTYINDSVDIWEEELKKHCKDLGFKYSLLLKILELSKKFNTIKFSVYKCRHAHDLSRVYLGHKNYDSIIKQLKKITKTKPPDKVDGAALLNKGKVCISKCKKKSKREKEILKAEYKDKDTLKKYFLDLPLAKYIYVYPNKFVSQKELGNHKHINILYNPCNNRIELYDNLKIIASFENRGNHLIPLINYSIAFLAKTYSNKNLHLSFKNISKEYTHYLWSQKRINLDFESSFKVLIRMLDKYNCTRISFEHSS